MTALTAVVMAKRPLPGRVKTRLVTAGLLDEAGAAAIALALLRCTLERLVRRMPVVLALAEDAADAGPPLAGVDDGPWRIVGQGDGDLGARLDRVWRSVGEDVPVAFFGADTPDVPGAALAAIAPALASADVAVGPTSDGGYWTLAASTYRPQVLCRIDWGGASVYDQTSRRAFEAGLRLHVLPAWHDVDHPADVFALQRRLTLEREAGEFGRAGRVGSAGLAKGAPAAWDSSLGTLATRLDALLATRHDSRDSRERHADD